MFAIAAATWSAYEANGVVIEAFSVPPDLAAKGLTGQVIATRLQDRLAALQAATYSFRAPSSYANNWGDDIKVQIPDTGVSIGELNRYLRNWLGHETHISGEVWHTPDGIAVTARAGSEASPVIAGREAEFDKLFLKLVARVPQKPSNRSSWRYSEHFGYQPIYKNIAFFLYSPIRAWTMYFFRNTLFRWKLLPKG